MLPIECSRKSSFHDTISETVQRCKRHGRPNEFDEFLSTQAPHAAFGIVHDEQSEPENIILGEK